ncbi:MAG: iron-sulfur cluster assembly scaffold protein [Chloroflexi bacterium]|jgi:nitrogen fixation NifU-like protein|nr:iron-sulfur cluster assembly scaffold protein [Chloroflexota bacterium]
MGAYKGKTDSTEDVRGLLRKEGYSEVVIDHWLNPRNLGQMKNYDGYSGKITSSCGDSMWVWLKVKDNVIQNATYVSDICIGAVSSGSMLTEMVKGKRVTEALWISPDDILRALGGLPENFVHCATLADTALKAAIRDYNIYKAAPWKRLYQQKH